MELFEALVPTVQYSIVQYSTVQYTLSSARWRVLPPAAAPHSARARAGGGQPSPAGGTRHQARIHIISSYLNISSIFVSKP